MKKVTFIYEPKPDKYNRRRGSFVYTREDLDMKCYCNEYTAKVLKSENDILDIINSLPILPILREKIFQTIEKYGENKATESREEVEDSFADQCSECDKEIDRGDF